MESSRRWRFSTLSGAAILGTSAFLVLLVPGVSASAKPPLPTVSKLTATPSAIKKAGEPVVISGRVNNADKCYFTSEIPGRSYPEEVSCTSGKVYDVVALPKNTGSKPRKYKFKLSVYGYDDKSVVSKPLSVTVGVGDGGTVALGGIAAETGSGGTECAALKSGGVDCWGVGTDGQLGNGLYITSDAPIAVDATSGTSVLDGVSQVSSSDGGTSFCAVLDGGSVDCWGRGTEGELGNGTSDSSSRPVGVEGDNGFGVLGGVTEVVGDAYSFCALVSSGNVECWGSGANGALGDGGTSDSTTPVSVEGVNGSGTLTGVTGLYTDGNGDGGFCALLASGGVDCWGPDAVGQLGNGNFGGELGYSSVPVAVVDVSGSGTLGGVQAMSGTSGGSNAGTFCALVSSGGVDCWGYGGNGGLGNGVFYGENPNGGSAVPVQVEGVGGSGTLSGVSGIVAGSLENDFCALLISSAVDCWGEGENGQLGNGTAYTASPYGSAVPVQVEGVGGSGTLSGVTSLVSGGNSFCALLSTSGVDCWGYGAGDELGNGTSYTASPYGSAVPVQVDGVGGSGTLSAATQLSSLGDGIGYCALLTSSGLDCWGVGGQGELGDGIFYQLSGHASSTAVSVIRNTTRP
jgi:alpha-tubulin suppressor-like RCC1 family protein